MITTENNIKLVMDTVLSQMVDENGRGEYDNETNLSYAIENTINMLESSANSNKGEIEVLCERCGDVIKYNDCYDDGDFDQQYCNECAKLEGFTID